MFQVQSQKAPSYPRLALPREIVPHKGYCRAITLDRVLGIPVAQTVSYRALHPHVDDTMIAVQVVPDVVSSRQVDPVVTVLIAKVYKMSPRTQLHASCNSGIVSNEGERCKSGNHTRFHASNNKKETP